MTTVERTTKLTNDIESEYRKISPNYQKIEKWEVQLNKCFSIIAKSENLQAQYEAETGCEWEGYDE